jgi:hypothetical protein
MDDDCGEQPHAMERSTANAALDEDFLISPLGGSSSRLSIETAPGTPGRRRGRQGPAACLQPRSGARIGAEASCRQC